MVYPDINVRSPERRRNIFMSRISVRRNRQPVTPTAEGSRWHVQRQRHNQGVVLAAACAGATLMYLFDPRMGLRRRTRIRDQFVRLGHVAQDWTAKTWRDACNRGQGLLAEARACFKNQSADDDILVERVRAKLGSLVRHPRSIEVQARESRIVLRGPILSSVVDRLLDGVGRVKGVERVENRLAEC